MSRKKINFCATILLPLILSEIVASIQIYVSNIDLASKAKYILHDSRFITPSGKILPLLENFREAMAGGVFFVLTTGLLLCFTGIIFGLIIKKTKYKKIISFIYLLLTGITAYYLHMRFALWILIPVSASILTYFASEIEILKHKSLIIPILFFLILITMFRGSSFFLDVRDKVLLQSRIGKSINLFYYRFTLYPAELIKPLSKKALKTFYCEDQNLNKKISRAMMKYGFKPSSSEEFSDLVILEDKDFLIFSKNEDMKFKMDKRKLYELPKILNDFSKKNDDALLLRKITMMGLILCLPIFALLLPYSILLIFFSAFLKDKTASLLSSIILTFLFFILFNPFFIHGNINHTNYNKMLSSEKRYIEKRDVLKFISEKKINANEDIIKNNLLDSKDVAVRYWSTLVFKIKTKKDLNSIEKKLNDLSLNVRCKAYEKLASVPYSMKDKAKKIIEDKYKDIDLWYVQLYAHNSLRKLSGR